MSRKTKRRHVRRIPFAFWHLDLHDWVLLTLLVSFGLVFTRIIFIVTMVHAPCADAIAAAGLIESGFLEGETVWSLLYLTSILCALYSVVWMGFDWRGFRAHFTFRFIILVGFISLSWGLRLMVIEEPAIPDGYLYIERGEPLLNEDRELNYEAYLFDEEDAVSYRPYFRHACVFADRGYVVVDYSGYAYNWNFKTRRQLLLGGKGQLLKGLAATETVWVLSPEQMSEVTPYMSLAIERFGQVPPNAQVITEETAFNVE